MADPIENLDIGELVQMKCGGPHLVVMQYFRHFYDSKVSVAWFNKGKELVEANIPVRALKRVEMLRIKMPTDWTTGAMKGNADD